MSENTPHITTWDVRSDPVLLAGLVVWVAALLPSWFPILPDALASAWADQYADVPSLLFVVGAAWYAGRRERSPERRTFWLALRLAMISWVGVRALFFLIPYEAWGVAFDLGADVLYISAYVLLGIGLEFLRTELAGRPAGGEYAPGDSPSERAAILVFSFFTLAFLVLSPGLFQPEAYASGSSSMLLYVLMDAWLILRAGQTMVSARRDPRWRVASTWLLVSCLLLLIGDTVEGLMYAEAIPWLDVATPWDTIWHLPPLTLLLAARAATVPEGRVSAPESTPAGAAI